MIPHMFTEKNKYLLIILIHPLLLHIASVFL